MTARLLQVRDVTTAKIYYAGSEHNAREHGKQASDTWNTSKKFAEYIMIIKVL